MHQEMEPRNFEDLYLVKTKFDVALNYYTTQAVQGITLTLYKFPST